MTLLLLPLAHIRYGTLNISVHAFYSRLIDLIPTLCHYLEQIIQPLYTSVMLPFFKMRDYIGYLQVSFLLQSVMVRFLGPWLKARIKYWLGVS